MHRRDVLKRLAAGAVGALGLGLPRLTRAQADGGKLVIVLAYGGWDAPWVLDPKPDWGDDLRPPGDLRWFGDLPIWSDPSRGAVDRFFEQWAARTAVVNGLAVESLAHETCIHTALTGQARGAHPDLGARVASALGAERALPYLALAPHAQVDGFEALAGELGVTNQLMGLSTRAFGWPAPGRFDADMGLDPQRLERAAIDIYLQAAAERLEAEPHGPRGRKLVEDYTRALPRARDLLDRARRGGVLSDYALFENAESPWQHVAGMLAEGISQVALVQPDLYWDTHAGNNQQGSNFEGFFAGLDALMGALSTRGIVDQTTVLVLSEMGRTPRINAQFGKDHWPWTSAMVIGPRVNGGRAFGQTDEWLRPAPLDLATGEFVADGALLHPEHLLGAVARLVGTGGPDWYARAPFDALVAGGA